LSQNIEYGSSKVVLSSTIDLVDVYNNFEHRVFSEDDPDFVDEQIELGIALRKKLLQVRLREEMCKTLIKACSLLKRRKRRRVE
jgi:hypothetical protein